MRACASVYEDLITKGKRIVFGKADEVQKWAGEGNFDIIWVKLFNIKYTMYKLYFNDWNIIMGY